MGFLDKIAGVAGAAGPYGALIGLGIGLLSDSGERTPRGPGLPYRDLADAEAERLKAIFRDPTGSDEFLAFKGGLGESLARYRSQLRADRERSGVSHRSGAFRRAELEADTDVLSKASENTSAFLAQLLRDQPGRLQQLLQIVGNFELGRFGAEVQGYRPGSSLTDRLSSGLNLGEGLQQALDAIYNSRPAG